MLNRLIRLNRLVAHQNRNNMRLKNISKNLTAKLTVNRINRLLRLKRFGSVRLIDFGYILPTPNYEPRRPAERATSNKAGSAKPRPPPGREGLKTRAARATRGAGWTRGPPAIIRTSKGTTTTASEEARARLLEPTRPRPAKGPRQDPIRQTIFLSGGGHEAELRLFGGFSG